MVPFEKATASMTDRAEHWGIYQIIGWHPFYGDKVVLYIGRAFDQSFSQRLTNHWKTFDLKWHKDRAPLFAQCTRSQTWIGRQRPWTASALDELEAYLIFNLAPALNSAGIRTRKAKREFNITTSGRVRPFGWPDWIAD